MSRLSQSFSKIYDKNVDKIYRFIFLKVSSQEVAEDLTSEVFTRGWRAYRDKKNSIDNVTAFLYQIARNLIVDHYKYKARFQLVSVENAPNLNNPGTDLEQEAMLKSDFNRVRLALTGLKEDYREVLVWYYLDELSVPEIAKILDKSEEATRMQIHRALSSLRSVINEGENRHK